MIFHLHFHVLVSKPAYLWPAASFLIQNDQDDPNQVLPSIVDHLKLQIARVV